MRLVNKKGLILLSGGLDSTLATRMMQEQGLSVEAVNFITVFCTCTRKGSCKHEARKVADEYGVKLHVVNVTEEYLEVVKKPEHGYGKNMNPCIDCRIFMFKKAKTIMKDIGASFVITGEVLGERPMSQRRDAINLIEKLSGLKGLIVRPLSAKHFEPTIPEQKGIIDRERLLGIKGRSRKPQIALAEQLGVEEYLCPAGGCLLTDHGFAKRMKDLVKHNEANVENIRLLKFGRHFRLDGTKIVMGRDQEDNERILDLAKEDDVIIKIKDIPGPITLIRGNGVDGKKEIAAALTAGYTKQKESEEVLAECTTTSGKATHTICVKPVSKEALRLETI